MRASRVDQLIEVLERFSANYRRTYDLNKAHIEATQEVARRHRVEAQTVQDMCTRVLGLPRVAAFRDLLERWMTGDSKPLLDVLKRHTPSYVHQNIEGVLAEGRTAMPSPTTESRPLVKDKPRPYESFSVPIDPETAKKLRVLSVMESVPIPDWLQRVVSDVVAVKYRTWLADQRQDNS